MRFPLSTTISAALLLVAIPAFGLVRPRHGATHATLRRASAKSHASSRAFLAHTATVHQAPGIDSERATQIQTALIKNGYLTGEPTGNWDADSVAAMRKLQADNGWPTRVTPDSRALIKLGLGPNPTAPTSPQ